MPKIVIREFDKTTAGGAPYANFSVVVPGFVKEEDPETGFKPDLTVFDDNGVYECTTQKEFKENIGLTSSVNHKVANAQAAKLHKEWDAPKALTEAEFLEYLKQGDLCTAVANSSGTTGKLKDKNWEYKVASEEFSSTYVFKTKADDAGDSFTLFAMLESFGHDDLYEDHYGNQIAYELLGLGYTVLYKKITGAAVLETAEFWRPLKDKTLYDFRYIMSGLTKSNAAVYSYMVDVAKFEPEKADFDTVGVDTHGRGDCIALLDVDENVYLGQTQENAIAAVLESASKMPKSKYAAIFAPTVKYAEGGLSDLKSFNNQWFPASFHYLACAARSYENFNEWYANAGYTRGISKYTIEAVGCKFGEAAVNMFQKRSKDAANNVLVSINPIINLRGSYYLWGNRTAFELGQAGTAEGDLKASHFLNIRQLCSTIKKKVYVTCRQATFDPNSDLLWVKFCNSIKPMLETMKADQGIADYKILKVKTSRKAFLSAVIRIVPIEAVEDFDISIYLEDSLSGVIATAEE